MSGTPALVAPRQDAAAAASHPDAPHRALWTMSPYALPVNALRILGTCALPLILVFSAGRLVRWALLLSAAAVAHGSWHQARPAVVTVLLTLVVMTSLATTVGMLYVVRGALLETRARRAEAGAEGGAEGEGGESLPGALRRAAPLFAVISIAWGLVAQDARDLANLDLAGLDLAGLDPRVCLAAAVVAYLVRWLSGRRHETGGGRVSGMLAAFGELALVFFGINAVVAAVAARSDWFGGRAVVAAWHDLMAGAADGVPGWSQVTGWLGGVWPHVIDALIVPLTWLMVGVLVYGAYAGSGSGLGAGWRSRWAPLPDSLRLTVRGGAPLFGLFALCYVGVRAGGDYLARAGHYLTASEEPYFWLVTAEPIAYVTDLVVTTLTMCLIAAAFDLAATRARTQAGHRPEHRPEQN